jgi:deoxyhypusine synthase
VKFLDADVKKRRKSLEKTIEWSPEDVAPSSEEDAEKHETYVR